MEVIEVDSEEEEATSAMTEEVVEISAATEVAEE